MIKVYKIFYSIQGEGVHQGVPMVFIRFAGCNMLPRCSYCDTSYAWDPQDGKDMDVPSIIEEIRILDSNYHKPWICITGGEPLWQSDGLVSLVRRLRKLGYHTTVETNGSFEVPKWYLLVHSWSADIKCPSSGVCGVSKAEWFNTRKQDQVKFVVSTKEDLDFTKKMIDKHITGKPTILVSPAADADKEGNWNKEWLQEVAEFTKEIGVRFSLQVHKVIWGDIQGV